MISDNISFGQILSQLWKKRLSIIKISSVFFVIGFLFAILAIKKYTVTTVIIPQTSNASNLKLGNLSSLAAAAGFDLGSLTSGDEIVSPLVYPKIVGSVPFQLELLQTRFYYPRIKKTITLQDYYLEYKKKGVGEIILKYTVGIPSLIMDALKKDSKQTDTLNRHFIIIDKDIEKIRKKLEDDIVVEINLKLGIITISGTFDDPVFTALVVDKTREMLQKYITAYKIEKAMQKMKFLEERYTELKSQFEQAQQKLAIFRDRNKNISNQLVRTEEEKLQAEYNLIFSVYSNIAAQLEQAKIQVKEDTPVFTVIEPTVVPYKKAAPNRIFIILAWTVLGALISVGIEFYRMLKDDLLQLK